MDDIELVKQKINIVDFISEYLPLKKSGINFKTNCPFHQEHTPSFMVSPERQIWHCFGCDKGGDIFKFLMEKEGIEFKEALEILAQKAGVVLKRTKKNTDEKDRLYQIHEKTQQFFEYLLTTHALGKKALDYLKKRGLTDQTIKEFGLGYAPSSWENLTKFLKKRGFSEKESTDSGLCVPSQRGCYDRFRGRITYPLIDQRGKIMGFSGRVLGLEQPKYLNTPQTPIFDKGKFLFGLNLTKSDIRQKKSAILVEGEMDALMSYQAGVKNVVASKGTALTEDQIELIKKYTDTILLCFDTDFAGDAASRRGIEIAEKAGLNIKIIQITGAKDPAEQIVSNPADWEQSVKNAIPIYDYYLESVSKRFDPKQALGKKMIFAEILPIFSKIIDPMVKEHYIQRLAALLQVKDDIVRSELKKLGSAPQINLTKPIETSDIVSLPDRRERLEEYLITLMLHLPSDLTFVPNFPETLFTQEELKQIYVLLVLFLDNISFKGKSFKIAEFAEATPESLMPIVDKLYLRETDEKLTEGKFWQKELNTVVSELKKMLIHSSLEKLSLQIKNAQEFGKMESLELLNKRFRDLSVKLKNL